jgi:hypothetical protein
VWGEDRVWLVVMMVVCGGGGGGQVIRGLCVLLV